MSGDTITVDAGPLVPVKSSQDYREAVVVRPPEHQV